MLPSDHLHVGPRQCIFDSLQIGLRVVGMGDNNNAFFLSDATHSEKENIVVKRHHSMRFRELNKMSLIVIGNLLPISGCSITLERYKDADDVDNTSPSRVGIFFVGG